MFAIWIYFWILAQETPSAEYVSWTTWLGPFAAFGALTVWILRDKTKENDRLLKAVEAQTPVLVEIRDILRLVVTHVESTGGAMSSIGDAIKRCPTNEEMARWRILYEDSERRATAARRRE